MSSTIGITNLLGRSMLLPPSNGPCESLRKWPDFGSRFLGSESLPELVQSVQDAMRKSLDSFVRAHPVQTVQVSCSKIGRFNSDLIKQVPPTREVGVGPSRASFRVVRVVRVVRVGPPARRGELRRAALRHHRPRPASWAAPRANLRLRALFLITRSCCSTHSTR